MNLSGNFFGKQFKMEDFLDFGISYRSSRIRVQSQGGGSPKIQTCWRFRGCHRGEDGFFKMTILKSGFMKCPYRGVNIHDDTWGVKADIDAFLTMASYGFSMGFGYCDPYSTSKYSEVTHVGHLPGYEFQRSMVV